MLTDVEVNLVRRVFAQGPTILLDEAYTIDEARNFLDRDDVKIAIALLTKEMSVADVTGSRLKFLARRTMAPLLNPAVATLARAMLGPVYTRDPAGNVMRDAKGNLVVTDPGPNSVQVAAASEILDRLNILPDAKVALVLDGGDMIMRMLPAVSKEATALENHTLGATEEERALARERIRNAMLSLATHVGGIKRTVEAKLKGPQIDKRRIREAVVRKRVKSKDPNVATTKQPPTA